MQLAIMTFNALPSCAIMLALIAGTSQGVKAGTTAYVGGGLLSGTVESCIKAMKTAADKTGFTESQETLMSDDKKLEIFTQTVKTRRFISPLPAIRCQGCGRLG